MRSFALPLPLRPILALCLWAICVLAAPLAAQNVAPDPIPRFPAPPVRPPSAPGRRVLDVERLQAVTAPRFPNEVPTVQVLVVGGGLGGVAAAEALARRGVSVIVTEPTSHLGGQFTSQGLGTPDENRFIEDDPGPSTRHYRELREQVRAAYAQAPAIKPGRAVNVGQCWVSRVSGEPGVWEQAINARLAPLAGPFGIRRVLLRHQLLDVRRYPGNGRVSYADLLDLDTGRIVRIGAQFLLDATPTGDALPLAQVPWTLGQEGQSAYGEPDAPPDAHPEWVQSFTYCFAVRLTPPDAPHPIIERPGEYDFFKSLGEYTLVYDYPEPRGPVPYAVFKKAPGAGGPFWTYRRLLAASSFARNTGTVGDVSLINWRGNDFREESFVHKSPDEQARILAQGKAFAQGFLYWLQTECPRDDGHGLGYPEMQPAGDVLGDDGFAPAPYVRESRRLLSETVLTENDLIPDPDRPDRTTGTDFPDSVGLALYAIDVHPAPGEPPRLATALPYALPLGAFIPRAGPANLVPAAIDFGASRLASASARMHPTEWLAGEVAGELAAFCLARDLAPTQVRHTPELLTAFQAQLEADGIPTRWSEVPTEKP